MVRHERVKEHRGKAFMFLFGFSLTTSIYQSKNPPFDRSS
jgi:hypothetical protein